MKKHFSLSLVFIILLPLEMPLRAQVWSGVPDGGTYKGTVFSVYADSYDDLLYVGGNYDSLGTYYLSSRGFGIWDENQWIDLTGGNDGFGNDITKAIGRYNGEIYHSLDIGAIFYGEQTEEHRIAKFSCTNPNCHGNTAYAFQPYLGELYTGGTFQSFKDTPDDLLHGLIKWDGTNWTKVSGGVRSIHPVNGTGVHALLVYKNKLYVGGTFDSAGNVACNNLAVWDGIAWSNVGTGLRGISGGRPRVNALTIYKGALIVAGDFDSAGSVAAKNIAKWDGTSWSSLNSTFDEAVKAVCVYKKNLYAGGDFSFNGNDSNHVAMWNGTSWSSLGGGITGGKFVRSLTVWHKMLVVGGAFTELEDSIVVANVAFWKTGGLDPLKENPGNLLEESDLVMAPNIISCPAVIRFSGTEEITQIEVIDQCGSRYLVQEVSNEDFDTSIELEAKNWHPGVYIVKVHTAEGTVNKKLVVM